MKAVKQYIWGSFNKGVKRNETTSPTFAGEDVHAYAKETGTLTDVYSLVHEISTYTICSKSVWRSKNDFRRSYTTVYGKNA